MPGNRFPYRVETLTGDGRTVKGTDDPSQRVGESDRPGDFYGASDLQPGRAVYTPFEVVPHGLEPTCG